MTELCGPQKTVGLQPPPRRKTGLHMNVTVVKLRRFGYPEREHDRQSRPIFHSRVIPHLQPGSGWRLHIGEALRGTPLDENQRKRRPGPSCSHTES